MGIIKQQTLQQLSNITGFLDLLPQLIKYRINIEPLDD